MDGSRLVSQAVFEHNLSQQTAAEYQDSILEHMIAMEKATRPDPAMIDQQPEIGWKLWPFMVDFMVDMHKKLGLEPQTLFMAVNIVNRYCARRIVYSKHFHLVGCTAMWIASKYEDKKSVVPTLNLLKHMCQGYYGEEMFVMMEGHILNTLDWTITHCTVDCFLKTLLNGSTTPLLGALTNYIAEITLFHKVFVGKDPHIIAKAIHAFSLHLLNSNVAITETDTRIQHWITVLADLILTPPRSVLEKYRHAGGAHSVTRVVDGWVLRRQRQVQEEAAAKARADAEAHRLAQLQAQKQAAVQLAGQKPPPLNILSRQSSAASLPMTPPPSAMRSRTHARSIDISGGNMSSAYSSSSDYTPPSSATVSHFNDPYNGSPLTVNSFSSLTSLTSMSSAASNASLGSMAPPHSMGMLESMSNSPPTTPLNPPKPFFRV